MNFLGRIRILPMVSDRILCNNVLKNTIPKVHRNGFHSLYSPRSNSSKKLLNLVQTRVFCTPAPKLAPPKKETAIGLWLLSCSGMVFGAVALGGMTRLTESGLSMVTWRFMGERYPRNKAEWKAEFKRYKKYPEYKYLKLKMKLREFKKIYQMEYAHRMWGRVLGLVFLIPAVVFWRKGRFNKDMKKRVAIMGGLILSQGLLGWYMVKSGLEDRFQGPSDIPRVSHYRLAAHLAAAFALYTLMLQTALNCISHPQDVYFDWTPRQLKALRFIQKSGHIAKGLIIATALSGALVSGLDAGLACSTFPKMNNKWIPNDIMKLVPWPSNFTTNPITVQFDHRLLGGITILFASYIYGHSKFITIPPKAYYASSFLGFFTVLQLFVGGLIVIDYVPFKQAVIHQNLSLCALSCAIWLTHELKRLPK